MVILLEAHRPVSVCYCSFNLLLKVILRFRF